jgi:transglutaminase-like putative cysteine protease
MRIRVGYDIAYDCPAPTPITLLLNVRPERISDILTPQVMTVSTGTPARAFTDIYGNIGARLVAPIGEIAFRADFIVSDSGLPDAAPTDAIQHAVDDLPDEVMLYLLGSRYCDTQHLMDQAWSEFGRSPLGWRRVADIAAYAHERIAFGYQHARSTRTGFEAHEERLGVCRDYAHLAITLCRCMNIPARYCTGYLGDIGIDPVPGPMDFSAWFEAYLGGRWWTFDARHNRPRIGRIPMAYGRDAVDTAITTTYGPAILTRFEVISEALEGDA